MGEALEGDEAGPVVFVRIAGQDSQPVAFLADGDAPAGIKADVSVDVGVDRVDGDGGEIPESGREFRPVPGPVHLIGGSGFVAVVQAHPAHRQGLAPGEIRRGRDDRAMPGGADGADRPAAAFDPDRLVAGLQRMPGAVAGS